MRKSNSVFVINSTDNKRINNMGSRFKGKFGANITSGGVVDFMSHHRKAGMAKNDIFAALHQAYEIPNNAILEVLWERSMR